ncbi:hypothetical protein [Nocardia bovistercoris]|uniref:Uncharacterized protein n=1 Tax=Nocardia bovistercoris TaxID=2785916 RepID=A0A931N3I2_9NOCA|nr:hypothetical protein [Nocardia bovistercoris]MBH0776588.1 hypothetical protein [Nocardia bovistercoris]
MTTTVLPKVLLGVSLIAALVTTAAPSHAEAPKSCHVTKVVEFEQKEGKPQWESGNRNRFANGRWSFDSDGTFSYTTTDVRDDIYPLHGKYTVSGDTLRFSAHGSSVIGASSSFVELEGKIDLGAKPAKAQSYVASGAGYGAVVNNQKFGATASALYGGTAELSCS